ncbi:MAG: IS110 family transposase [Desulfomonilaceae bacterium]
MVKTQNSATVSISAKDTGFRNAVSLDVHEKNTYVFAMDVKTGEIKFDHNVLGPISVALKAIDRLSLSKGETMVFYESGSCGFHPARLFAKAGYSCKIIAANSIPRKGSGKKKNDRTDAVNNFHYFMAGTLHFVTVPSETEVADREIIRYRRDLAERIGKQKQQIYAFAKRYGLVFDSGKASWTVAHRKWLKTVAVHQSLRFVLDGHIEELETLEAKLSEVEKTLNEIFKTNARYKASQEIYSLLPGIGPINAMTLVLEGGDLRRFPHPKALMSYAGLMPGNRSSGGSNPEVSITKEGSALLRLALVNAASAYRDNRQIYSIKAIDAMDCPIRKEFLKRLQGRLCMRYRHLRDVGKKRGNEAKCAVARELAGFVWELATKIAPRLEEYKFAA